MIIDTEKYQQLLIAAHIAVEQMKRSNNLLAKLLHCGPSQPLLDAMQQLEQILGEIDE